MLRLACFFLVAATMIGALMPSPRKSSATTTDENGVVYTPQSEGSSYRVVDGGGGSGRSATTSSGGEIHLEREADGHFYITANVNGSPVNFLVDTGASGVALTRADAQSAGLALDRGTDRVGEGAGGAVMGQWVELDRIEVGSKTVSGVNAAVIEGGNQSLLGQDVLREFDIEVQGDEMVLR